MIILLIISLIILSGLIRVNATSAKDWASNLPSLTRIDLWDCNVNGCANSISASSQGLVTSYGNRDMIVTNNQVTIATHGIKMSAPYVNKQGYLYQTTFYVCSSKDINSINFEVYSSQGSNAKNHNNIYNQTEIIGTTNIPGDGSHSFGSCRQITGLYVPESNSKWVSARIKNSNSSIKTHLQVIAVDNRELGVYTDTIKEIVESANGNVVDAVDKVNNTLNQNHEYNNNASENTENEKQEMENYKQEEDNLRNGLDLTIEESEITINPEANTFIWNVVDKLRGMSGKIVLLFTSVLSLGIMKMILGR